MNSPAHDIALFLTGHGVGTLAGKTGWGIYYHVQPALPHSVVTIFDSPGFEPDTDQMDVFRPSFEIRTRAVSADACYNKQEEIRDLLLYDLPIIAATSRFTLVNLVSDVSVLGRDENERIEMATNYTARRVKLED